MRTVLRVLFAAVLLAAALVSPAPAVAQENPDVARGFSAEKLYQFGEVDAVNLFNGNLTLALPLGPSYTASGNLTYNLTLTYNSNVWRFEQRTWKKYGVGGNYELVTSKVALLDRTYNASPGRKVSLGELLDWADPDNPGGRWAYLGEDGSHHTFYETLHNCHGPADCEPVVTGTWYTRDGSYLRLRKLSGTEFEVDFPDGSTRSFYRDVGNWTTKFRPQWIEDAFGNRLTITQVSNLHWHFADTHREHNLYFTNLTIDGTTWKVVDRAVLAAFNGGTATYQFHYTPKTIDESCYDEDDLDTVADADGVMTPAQRSIYVLADVTLPDGSTWKMPTYYTACSEGSGADLSESENQPGVLKKLVLPTLGAYEWTYRDYSFPTRVVGGSQGAGTLSAALSTGVRRKRMLNASGGCFSFGQVGCEWTYEPAHDWANFEHSTRVTYPSGDQTRFYFDVHWRGNPTTWDGWQYGLPFTTAATDGAGRFLSQEIYAGAESPANLRRRVYVRYERDRINSADVLPDQWENLNRRPASRKTVYADDAGAWRSEDFSDFDGLGHYRNRTTNASWAGGASRTDFTAYNPTSQSYNVNAVTNTVSGGYQGPPATWVLGTYTERSQTEGTDTARQYQCFDAATGALVRERVLRTTTRSTTDVVRQYERGPNGNVIRERHYGGDTTPISTTTDLCGMALPAEAYRRDDSYLYGTLLNSRWLTGSGAHVLWTYQSGRLDLHPCLHLRRFRQLDQHPGSLRPRRPLDPVNPATNRLTTAGYDSAGNVTSWNGTGFEYDAMGMVKKRIDSGGGEWLFFYTADDERLWSYHWTGSRWTIRDLDGKALRDYRAGPSGWSVERDYVYADGKLLAAVKPSPAVTYHYHLDHLGTPRLVTNQFGNQVAYHAYFPYGEEATNWGQDTETMKFTGHERDFYSSGPGDDLDYQHARYYNPLQGRYLSVDRLLRISRAKKKPQLWNLYSYVGGNPLAFVDPTGLYLVVPNAKSTKDAQDEVEAFQAALEEIGESEIAETIQAEVVDGEVRITAGGADIDAQSGATTVKLIASLIAARDRITVEVTGRDLSQFGGARTDSSALGGAIGILLNPAQIADTRVQGRFTGGRFAGMSGPIGVSLGTALVHELGHAAGYVDKSRLAHTNADALYYENQHRKLLTTTWTHTERTSH